MPLIAVPQGLARGRRGRRGPRRTALERRDAVEVIGDDRVGGRAP